MYVQGNKSKENKSRTVANTVTQKKSNVKQGFGFVDNRPEAITQKKTQNTVMQRTIWKHSGEWKIYYLTMNEEKPPYLGQEGDYHDNEATNGWSDPPASEVPNSIATIRKKTGNWDVIDNHPSYHNCISFATFGALSEQLTIEEMRSWFKEKKLEEKKNEADATIVFFGNEKFVTHGMRKVNGSWQEVAGSGMAQRKYVGEAVIPPDPGDDKIVLMF